LGMLGFPCCACVKALGINRVTSNTRENIPFRSWEFIVKGFLTLTCGIGTKN
jgi:hypothetical protein